MADESVDTRKKYVEAWNKTMIDIWQERIHKLKVIDSGDLWRSPIALKIRHDDRFFDISLSQKFLEYGIWQDLGVGRELGHGDYEHNRDYIDKHGRPREKRRWFSTKYYSSVLALRDFMADSLANEFKGIFSNIFDSDKVKQSTDFYRRKGYI